MPTRELTERDRVEILLVFGAEIKTVRGARGDDPGTPGIRVTAGYDDGTVLLEAVGFEPAWSGDALRAMDEAVDACYAAGLHVYMAPFYMTDLHARIVRRRPA